MVRVGGKPDQGLEHLLAALDAATQRISQSRWQARSGIRTSRLHLARLLALSVRVGGKPDEGLELSNKQGHTSAPDVRVGGKPDQGLERLELYRARRYERVRVGGKPDQGLELSRSADGWHFIFVRVGGKPDQGLELFIVLSILPFLLRQSRWQARSGITTS